MSGRSQARKIKNVHGLGYKLGPLLQAKWHQKYGPSFYGSRDTPFHKNSNIFKSCKKKIIWLVRFEPPTTVTKDWRITDWAIQSTMKFFISSFYLFVVCIILLIILWLYYYIKTPMCSCLFNIRPGILSYYIKGLLELNSIFLKK